METCSPVATTRQFRRDKAGSGAQSWFEESRPMDTSPGDREKAVPFKGPPIPTSLGFNSDVILRCLAQIGLPCTRRFVLDCVGPGRSLPGAQSKAPTRSHTVR